MVKALPAERRGLGGEVLFVRGRKRALLRYFVFLFRVRDAVPKRGAAESQRAHIVVMVCSLGLLLPRFSFLVFSIRDKSRMPAEGLRKE